jgi:hypothetical protein
LIKLSASLTGLHTKTNHNSSHWKSTALQQLHCTIVAVDAELYHTQHSAHTLQAPLQTWRAAAGTQCTPMAPVRTAASAVRVKQISLPPLQVLHKALKLADFWRKVTTGCSTLDSSTQMPDALP